jgi:hypothetical protein
MASKLKIRVNALVQSLAATLDTQLPAAAVVTKGGK